MFFCGVEVLFGNHSELNSIGKEFGESLHGIAIFVINIDLGAFQGEMCESRCIGKCGKHQFGDAMLILPNDEGLIDLLHRFEGIEMIGDDIAECVFQTICGNLWSVVIGNGIEMIVCHIDGLQGVFM